MRANFFFVFGRKISARLPNLNSTCLEEHFEEKFFIKKSQKFQFFGKFIKNSQKVWHEISSGMSRVHSMCPEKYFEEKSSRIRNFKPILFSNFLRKKTS